MAERTDGDTTQDSNGEALADQDADEVLAFSGPVDDPDVIADAAVEGSDDLAELPARRPSGFVPHDTVDGTDAEAVYEEEAREVSDLEDELSEASGEAPDLVDLHDAHISDEPFADQVPDDQA
ncbi:MAG: hypothetical protein K1X95_08150 [Acidimicrobiia bacterium]|nr:hypothetical protein [Acidimicrobiia bacterium]